MNAYVCTCTSTYIYIYTYVCICSRFEGYVGIDLSLCMYAERQCKKEAERERA